MSASVDLDVARSTFDRAVILADGGGADQAWEKRIVYLSKVCETAPKTHIAFLGTALLAKASNLAVDVFALHVKAGTPGAYSARAIAQHILVPGARLAKVDIGVSGKEPLNNQPYFRHHYVSREMVVHSRAKAALEVVCDLLDDLSTVANLESALAALAAFVIVRKGYWKEPAPYSSPEGALVLIEFVQLLEDFVSQNSEGGRRAQAVAAGLMDAFQDAGAVETQRINDPSRDIPGDIAVYHTTDESAPVPRMVVEVRDKPVTDSDLDIFSSQAAKMVGRAAMLAVSFGQQPLDISSAQARAARLGLDLEVFIGWIPYARQIFFWSPDDAAKAIRAAHEFIYERLIDLECSAEAQEAWLEWRPPGSNA